MYMKKLFPLSPRYRLDDDSHWLDGVDSARYYWIAVNSDRTYQAAIPGLTVSSLNELKEAIRNFRGLQPGEQMAIARSPETSIIYCVSENFYALEAEVKGAKVWHLFDYETLDSLLMTGHPRWQCRPKDTNLGSQPIVPGWQRAAVA